MNRELKHSIKHLDDVIVTVENRKLTEKEKEELKAAIKKRREELHETNLSMRNKSSKSGISAGKGKAKKNIK